VVAGRGDGPVADGEADALAIIYRMTYPRQIGCEVDGAIAGGRSTSARIIARR
jgi:hypothetical protein